MLPTLTEKQWTFLEFLKRRIDGTGRSPSLREAAGELGVSHAAVVQWIKALEEKGYLRREGRYSRKIFLLNRSHEVAGPQRWREVPILGRIAAGLPLYAQQEWNGSLLVDGAFFKVQNLFVLRVQGDSMTEVGILNGDLVLCEPRQYARNGEIVVSLIRGEEATDKHFFQRKDHLELRPANSRYAPMRYGFDEVLIQGKVIGLVRGPEYFAKF
jgi:repressor LexA